MSLLWGTVLAVCRVVQNPAGTDSSASNTPNYSLSHRASHCNPVERCRPLNLRKPTYWNVLAVLRLHQSSRYALCGLDTEHLFRIMVYDMKRGIVCQTILKKRNKTQKMYHIKHDQRAIRSAEMLYRGLAKLMQTLPFDAIKVSDLVEASHVGRTTFYRNFDTVEDVLRLRSDQVFDDMIQAVIVYIREHGNEPRTLLLKPVLCYFDEQSEIIELLLQANRLDIAMASFQQATVPFREQILDYYPEINVAYIDYGITIRLGLITNILVQWIGAGKQQPPDELADIMSDMIKNMVTLDQLL
ncbi:MAG: TetR/AcrR family transcriptional regulator [Phototrophicaceae bacterium]